MHLLAYLVLVFFVWLAISPYEKVRWNRVKVWIVLAVIVWYGATDEWLQAHLGRQMELMDFIWDLGQDFKLATRNIREKLKKLTTQIIKNSFILSIVNIQRR